MAKRELTPEFREFLACLNRAGANNLTLAVPARLKMLLETSGKPLVLLVAAQAGHPEALALALQVGDG